MSFLPDIEDGALQPQKERTLYTPPVTHFRKRLSEEERLTEINNLDRKKVAEDFSDSPHLDR